MSPTNHWRVSKPIWARGSDALRLRAPSMETFIQTSRPRSPDQLPEISFFPTDRNSAPLSPELVSSPRSLSNKSAWPVSTNNATPSQPDDSGRLSFFFFLRAATPSRTCTLEHESGSHSLSDSLSNCGPPPCVLSPPLWSPLGNSRILIAHSAHYVIISCQFYATD